MGHHPPPALTSIRQCRTFAMYTFIETKLFSRLIVDYMTDDDYAALQCHLAVHPESGDVIQGSGGVRKMRWAGTGRGKRGGLRVIYYLRTRQGQIWLLTVYPKNVRDSIPVSTLRKIKEELDGSP